jgi:hypothetical protein
MGRARKTTSQYGGVWDGGKKEYLLEEQAEKKRH